MSRLIAWTWLTMGLFSLSEGTHYYHHPMEKDHNPRLYQTTMDPVVDAATDTKRESTRWTPDFRLPENMLESYESMYTVEHLRPYRVSPHKKITDYFPKDDRAYQYGCYCTTVYKRFRVLAGCAVITTRHLLTTATSTELILEHFDHRKNLEDILGAWYEISRYNFNSSMYMTPARIHYHPLYTFPKDVNRSHPFPVMHDLAVWVSTYQFHGAVAVCSRGGPHKWDHSPGTPNHRGYFNAFGYQFMRAYNRRPRPWYKYTVRFSKYEAIIPCPKTEWGWYHCFLTGQWAPLGLDHGSPLHRRVGGEWKYDGLIGMNVLNMDLRSRQMISYFIDLNNHSVLEFFYRAYQGTTPVRYLDDRFEKTPNKNHPLRPRPDAGHIRDYRQEWPSETYSRVGCCLYEKYREAFKGR